MKRYNAPLSETAAQLRRRETDLETYYTEVETRVEAVEENLHSFVERPDFESLRQTLANIRHRWGHSDVRPPLYGVNVGVKDIFRADGFPTRAGSDLPASVFDGPEAATVTALREAGAVVTGKTVTTEFAGAPTGPTRNPHDLAHTPGGSSSGSAAAVSAGLVPLALGTQTVGSVVRPAAFCGIVGFKPSSERVPMDGIVPVSRSVDQVGMFTQDLPGTALAASVLCSNWTPTNTETAPTLGVPSGQYLEQASETGREHLERQLSALAAAGVEVRRLSVFNDIEALNERHTTLVDAEAALVHAEWYTEYGDRYHPKSAETVENGWETDIEAVGRGRASQRRTRNRIAETMAEADVDVLVSPAAPGPAPEGLEDSGDPVMNLPWTHAGLPALTIPAGTTDQRLPIGLQCVAPYGDDERLLADVMSLTERLS